MTPPSCRRRPLIVLVSLLAAQLVVVLVIARLTYRTIPQLWLMIGAFLLFVPAVLLARRVEREFDRRRLAQLVLGFSLLLQIAAVTGPPATSDDDWRYLWDGRVQVHGIDPYRYPVLAPALIPLRTDTFFPPQRPCQYHRFVEAGAPAGGNDGCTRINRPGAPTVYPPVAELYFTAMYLITFGGHGNEFSMQVAGGLGVMIIGWLLYRRIRARGDPIWPLTLWAWCPTVVLEATQNAHVDWLGVLLVAAAITAVPASRPVLRGLLMGAATGVKLYPGVVGAAMVKRRPMLLIGAAAAVFVASYVPHVLAVGARVIGFLPGYLQQENYSTGTRYLLISLLLPGQAATIAAVVIMVLVLGWTIWRGDPDHPERAAVVLVGVAFFVATPNTAWYTLMLIMLASLAGRPEWLILGPVMGVYYLANGHVAHIEVVGRWGYLVALLVVISAAGWRRYQGVSSAAPKPSMPSVQGRAGSG